MWIVFSILALLLFLLFLPVTAEAAYQRELTLKIHYLFFHFNALPAKAKKETEDKPSKEKKEKGKEESDKKQENKKNTLDSALELLELTKQALSSLRNPLGWFLRKIRYRDLWLHITVCQEDAHQTALRYGQVQAMFHSVFSLLRNGIDIHTTDIRINADFIGEEEQFAGGVKVKIRPLYALIFVLWFAGSFGIGHLKQKYVESKLEKELREKNSTSSKETK